jgi:hypothetical protein
MTEQTQSPQPVKIEPYPTFDPGIEIRFRGIELDAAGEPVGEMVDVVLTVPPMNFRNLQRLEKHFSDINGGNAAAMSAMCDVLAAALSQNYRGVPRWLIEQSVRIDNLTDLTAAVMDVSGLRRKAIDEKKATAAAALSTGAPSSPTSSQPPPA